MAGIEVAPVTNAADLRAFIDLPWSIYPRNSNWVPPLKSEVRHILDRDKHPFWKFAERELFLARRHGKTVGRIAAIVDPNYNRFHEERMGAFGFFECFNDSEAAAALFDAARSFARDKKMSFVRGPLNPSTNYEIGALIDGFEHPPVVMMPWNLPYYNELIESTGFAKEKDLLAFYIGPNDFPAERTERLAKVIVKRNNISLRCADKRNYAGEMALIKEIYHASWERSWGFVPMTDDEINEMGRNLQRFADLDLVFFIYHGDDPAGLAVILPDINPILKLFNGRIGPIGLAKMLLFGRRRHGWRGTVFGFKEQYRKLGLPLVAFDYCNRVLRDPRKRSSFLELGWNLEDNKDINRFDTDVGGKIYKRYRIYRQDL
ncbi:MAG TPA: hypothetical protein VHD36_19540 [Pirellulales bacterium]|nr:hypothetical protein [Pirellulales bacterium]